MRTRSHASEIDAACEKDPRAKVPKGKVKVTNRGKQRDIGQDQAVALSARCARLGRRVYR